MTRAAFALAPIALAAAIGVTLRADRFVYPPVKDSSLPAVERHHYTIGARVRPLLVFWISKSSVGDAIVTRHRAPGEARYSLLIGTDPDRTPLRINRWGYIEEEIRDGHARLLGLMTQSDEESIDEAETNVRQQASGRHPFKVIHATADGSEAHARVASINLPVDYTVRQMRAVLDRAEQVASTGTQRAVQLPAGARPGFLAALADAMRTPERSIAYAYYGRLYDLRRIRSRTIPNVKIAQRSYGPGIAADFTVTSRYDGEQTAFSMTYGTDGAYAEVPLTVVYQPRWWMQVELTIDDQNDSPSIDAGATP